MSLGLCIRYQQNKQGLLFQGFTVPGGFGHLNFCKAVAIVMEEEGDVVPYFSFFVFYKGDTEQGG